MKLPLLRGTIIKTDQGNYQLLVWCPFCRVFHVHGWAQMPYREEHRVAHCGSGPLYESGYMIAPWRKTDPGYIEHLKLDTQDLPAQDVEKSG